MTSTIMYFIKSLLIGIVGIYLINIFGQYINFNIPINHFTIFMIGFFRIPGIIFLAIILLI